MALTVIFKGQKCQIWFIYYLNAFFLNLYSFNIPKGQFGYFATFRQFSQKRFDNFLMLTYDQLFMYTMIH